MRGFFVVWLGLFSVSGSADTAADTLQGALQRAHWLLELGEELHSCFCIVRGVRLMQASVSDSQQICAANFDAGASGVSRRTYENSWTQVYRADLLESVFNGTCFTKWAGVCESYSACQDVTLTYPTLRDPNGKAFFAPDTQALDGIRWAASQAGVEAWHIEQADLLRQLRAVPLASPLDSDIDRARYLLAGLAEARSWLNLHVSSLLVIAASRAQRFMAMAGASGMPTCLGTLANQIRDLMNMAAANTCQTNVTQVSPGSIGASLGGLASAIALVNSTAVLQINVFDTATRTVEALVVGTALLLHAGTLLKFTEFQCQVDADPRNAQLADIEPLRVAAQALLVALDVQLQPDRSNRSTSLVQTCLSDRVHLAASVSGGVGGVAAATNTLLSLDFCRHLFVAVAYEVASVVPYTDAAAPASSTTFLPASGELRYMYTDVVGSLGYVSPYSLVVDRLRGGVDDTAFAADDKVIQLRLVTDDGDVRAAGTPPSMNWCSQDNISTWGRSTPAVPCDGGVATTACTVPGCWRNGVRCEIATPGWYTLGLGTFRCPQDVTCPGSTASCYYQYALQWPNSTCPFVCVAADLFPRGRSCAAAPQGYFAPPCSNQLVPCSIPQGVTPDVFNALAQFTTPGQGRAAGCEVKLAFPLVAAKRLPSLDPPFTVQLFVMVQPDDIPRGAASVPSLAILAGSFPRWYLALRRTSSSSVKVSFYHSRLTQAQNSRLDSIVDSNEVQWPVQWHHIAVVVTSADAVAPNILFFVDGALVSVASRPARASSAAEILPDKLDVFHVGPPNMLLFPSILQDGRTEPYFYTSGAQFFKAQVDEVRVSRTALDAFTLGNRLTELRMRQVCDQPFERQDGSMCLPVARFTLPYSAQAQTSCQPGYESCGARPGLCVASCSAGTLRQSDCTCDCPSGLFQTWSVKVVYLTGIGDISNATVYDATRRVVGYVGASVLPQRIQLVASMGVAMVTVRGGGSATAVSLDVETAEGERFAVLAHRNVSLYSDRDAILHHRRIYDFFDITLGCSACPGQVLGSQLPRQDMLACQCVNGWGRSLLGECVPLLGRLPSPLFAPLARNLTAGTLVRVVMPPVAVEGPWLLEMRYEVGIGGQVPPAATCLSSLKYVEQAGLPAGLDIVRQRRIATVKAVLCHPAHFASDQAVATFRGNDNMNPPRCNADGMLSTDTTYAFTVTVTISILNQPGAMIQYRIGGSANAPQVYTQPIRVSTQGLTQISTWATQDGYDASTETVCEYRVDVAARLTMKQSWPDGIYQIGGFAYAQNAFLVRRNVSQLRLSLAPQLPDGTIPQNPVLMQYRLTSGTSPVGTWLASSPNGSVWIDLPGLIQPADNTTTITIEWRAKEPGYVWTDPAGVRLLLVLTRSTCPLFQVEVVQRWNIGDNWLPGPRRDIALRQEHRVTLVPPPAGVRVLFMIGNWTYKAPLLQVSQSDVTSVEKGLLDNFTSMWPSASWGSDLLASKCGPTNPPSSVPQLCQYVQPFTVTAGSSVTAFAFEPGKLESPAAVLVVAREQEPAVGALRFQVEVAVTEPPALASVSGMPGVSMLSSAATDLRFSLGLSTAQLGGELQSCVLLSQFVLELGGSVGTRRVSDCSWLAYGNPMIIPLSQSVAPFEAAAAAAGLPTDVSLNVSILTSVKLPGYLWAYPTTESFLWLRERTVPPALVTVLAPGSPAAMIWLQGEPSSGSQGMVGTGQAAAQQLPSDPPRCYFTLNSVPVLQAQLPTPWLTGVASTRVVLPSIRQAMMPAPAALAAMGLQTWRSNLRACIWPNVCQMPLNGSLPTELVTATDTADVPNLCAWAVWYGYRESLPACMRMDGQVAVAMETPSFLPPVGWPVGGFSSVVPVGIEEVLGAVVVTLQAPQSTRASVTRLGLPVFLNRTFPLQIRYAVLPLSVEALYSNASTVVGSTQFSAWRDLGPTDETPVVPMPTAAPPSMHIFIAVEVRLFVGPNVWNQPSPALCIVLNGQHPAVYIRQRGRKVVLQNPLNSTMLYRWLRNESDEPRTIGGGGIVRLVRGFTDVLNAYQLDSGIGRQLRTGNDASRQCASSDALQANAQATLELTLGPCLCATNSSSQEVAAPDSRRWVLWVAAYAAGLELSAPSKIAVEAQCLVPDNISFAGDPPCSEGWAIDSEGQCSPRCRAGYLPSALRLACSQGTLSPGTFSCEEAPCSVPSGVAHMSSRPCTEGTMEQLNAGRTCTLQCNEGFSPTEPVLTCFAGQLRPLNFSCQESPCLAPLAVVHAAQPSCNGSHLLSSGSNCTAQCQVGYVASQSTLSCSMGRLVPAAFECHAAACSAPVGVPYAMAESCIEGAIVQSNGGCTPQCQDGYMSSEPRLGCNLGVLTPPRFTCEELPCSAPSNATGCLEGIPVASRGICTTTCPDGYVPSTSVLQCRKGSLSPLDFECLEAPCAAPEDVLHGADPSCSGLRKVPSGATCVPQCQDGFVPVEAALPCKRGVLSPPTFHCQETSNLKTIAIGISGFAAASVALAVLVIAAARWRRSREPPKQVETQEVPDALQAWWACVTEVDSGLCVFCGQRPVVAEGDERVHGPHTIFRCCGYCAAVLVDTNNVNAKGGGARHSCRQTAAGAEEKVCFLGGDDKKQSAQRASGHGQAFPMRLSGGEASKSEAAEVQKVICPAPKARRRREERPLREPPSGA